MGQIKIHLPRLPHVERLQTGQQTKLGRKRCELVPVDLKQRACGQIVVQSLQHRTMSSTSVVRCAISLGSEQSLLLKSERNFTFFMRNNSGGSSVRPISDSWRRGELSDVQIIDSRRPFHRRARTVSRRRLPLSGNEESAQPLQQTTGRTQRHSAQSPRAQQAKLKLQDVPRQVHRPSTTARGVYRESA
jgi:hypothetical protein